MRGSSSEATSWIAAVVLGLALGAVILLAFFATHFSVWEDSTAELKRELSTWSRTREDKRMQAATAAARERANADLHALALAIPLHWRFGTLTQVVRLRVDGTVETASAGPERSAALAAAFDEILRLGHSEWINTGTVDLAAERGRNASLDWMALGQAHQLLTVTGGTVAAGLMGQYLVDRDFAQAHPPAAQGPVPPGMPGYHAIARFDDDGRLDQAFLSNSLRTLLPIVDETQRLDPLLMTELSAGKLGVLGPKGTAVLDEQGHGTVKLGGGLNAWGSYGYWPRLRTLADGTALVFQRTGTPGLDRLLHFDSQMTADPDFDAKSAGATGPFRDVVPLPSGKILVVNEGSGLPLIRLNADGSPDPSFRPRLAGDATEVSLTRSPRVVDGRGDRVVLAFAYQSKLESGGRAFVRQPAAQPNRPQPPRPWAPRFVPDDVGAQPTRSFRQAIAELDDHGEELVAFRQAADAAIGGLPCAVDVVLPDGADGWFVGCSQHDYFMALAPDGTPRLAPKLDPTVANRLWFGPLAVDQHLYFVVAENQR